MNRHLSAILIAGAVLCAASAATAQGISAVRENGRVVYVNDVPPSRPAQAVAQAASAQPSTPKKYMYWSRGERRWIVLEPSATALEAARVAAAEVERYASQAPRAAKKPRRQYASGTRLAASSVNDSAFDEAILAAATRHNVDPNLVRAVIKVESNFNPHARSSKGAIGLMQLMPATAKSLKVANPYDVHQNLDGGVRYLKQLLNNYGGNIELSLAAYNAGSGAVQKYKGVPNYRETKNYVKRITELYGGRWMANLSPAPAPIRMSREQDGSMRFSNTD